MDAVHQANLVQALDVPEVEVVARAARRRFSAAYKLRIVQEADKCNEPGQIGALLRREGIYSSPNWRQQRELGALHGSEASRNRASQEARLLKANDREITRKLETAEMVIEVQKNSASTLDSQPQRRKSRDHEGDYYFGNRVKRSRCMSAHGCAA